MATEHPVVPVNGNYGHHNSTGNGLSEANHQSNSTTTTSGYPPASTSTGVSSSATSNDVPKDQIGWYFVERYYTTLSRNPENLHRFYNKRSQFVAGVEEDKVSVYMGQQNIGERIKELDWEDAKVRVNNVDSQGSDDSIVIQVIGEISNRSAPHKKFVQTFVLAAQTNGYFVLNDIFRFLAEEEEYEGQDLSVEQAADQGGAKEPVPTGANTWSGGPQTAEIMTQEKAVAEVDHKLEDIIKDKDDPANANGASSSEQTAPAAAEATPIVDSSIAEEEAKVGTASSASGKLTAGAEKSTESSANQAAPSSKNPTAAPAAPSAAAKPAVPKTWANLAAAANRSAAPSSTAAPPSAQSTTQPKTTASSLGNASAAPSGAGSAAPARQASPSNNSGESGWQTAGHDHHKRDSRVPQQSNANENPGNRAYIKNVFESVDVDTLKAAMLKFGELAYFDVSRQKNCAFVDFATVSGFQAAVAANPHQIGDDTIYVEERRIRPSTFQNSRGGMGRGRGSYDSRPGQGRGAFGKDGPRGGFSGRGRGSSNPRGRGGSQAQ